MDLGSGSAALELARRMDNYHVCGTPHIESYGPDGERLVADDCGHKHGLRFLEAWMADEDRQGTRGCAGHRSGFAQELDVEAHRPER